MFSILIPQPKAFSKSSSDFKVEIKSVGI